MSVHDSASILLQLTQVADGPLIDLALAYVGVRSILKFIVTSALHKIDNAPSLRVSDLRSVLSSSENNVNSDSSTQSQCDGGKLVIVHATVLVKSAVEGNWKSLRANVLSSHETAEK